MIEGIIYFKIAVIQLRGEALNRQVPSPKFALGI
jgi:hypothetical protein